MRALVLVAALLAASSAGAHGVGTAVADVGAVTVTCTYDDGSPVSYESYEIAAPGGGPPFQVGRTDQLGRVVFVPDRPGDWSVKVMGEDGHGAVVPVTVDAAMAASGAGAPRAAMGRWTKMTTGVAILFGVFGVASLVLRRKV